MIKYTPIADRQFTGLLDKNKKEYSHKDIFNIPCSNAGCRSYVIGHSHVVEWNFGGWGFYDKLQRWAFLYKYAKDGEIIGNIYENAELLKSYL